MGTTASMATWIIVWITGRDITDRFPLAGNILPITERSSTARRCMTRMGMKVLAGIDKSRSV